MNDMAAPDHRKAIPELNPDMTLNEVANIFEASEAEVWDEYIEPFTRFKYRKSLAKITLKDVATQQAFIAFVGRGSSEGIYLTVEGIGEGGKRQTAFVCKTLRSPDDSEHWDKCWLSAGRISKALNEMWWD